MYNIHISLLREHIFLHNEVNAITLKAYRTERKHEKGSDCIIFFLTAM